MSDYGVKLLGWMKENGIESESLKAYFLSNAPDKDKEMEADRYRAFYSEARKEGHSHDPENELMHLEPYREADGSFGYIDRRKGGVVVSVKRQSNGLFSYFGPKKYITMLFGRAELKGLAEATADGDYWNKG